ncbi:DUF397 domain-containing protein [Planosporangium thailandense]|uniref:DUF397 domain-containing protein n=1 Tax=Planosporangium thailandense TaxID=765197 RepID=A0ABX0XSJ7_9ACTN|nr:DUF397 domain-containing protein [Planosporangium thailandense]
MDPRHPQYVWRRSSRCGSGACVEVAEIDGSIVVRDSKNPSGSWLAFDRSEWHAFLAGVRTGEFDFD